MSEPVCHTYQQVVEDVMHMQPPVSVSNAQESPIATPDVTTDDIETLRQHMTDFTVEDMSDSEHTSDDTWSDATLLENYPKHYYWHQWDGRWWTYWRGEWWSIWFHRKKSQEWYSYPYQYHS